MAQSGRALVGCDLFARDEQPFVGELVGRLLNSSRRHLPILHSSVRQIGLRGRVQTELGRHASAHAYGVGPGQAATANHGLFAMSVARPKPNLRKLEIIVDAGLWWVVQIFVIRQ